MKPNQKRLMNKIKIGIIGGSGLYQMPELTDIEEVNVETPFGKPSDAFLVGTLEGERVAFLPRHARGHRQGLGAQGLPRHHRRSLRRGRLRPLRGLGGPHHKYTFVLAARKLRLASFSLSHVSSGYAPSLRPCHACFSLAKTELYLWYGPLK